MRSCVLEVRTIKVICAEARESASIYSVLCAYLARCVQIFYAVQDSPQKENSDGRAIAIFDMLIEAGNPG